MLFEDVKLICIGTHEENYNEMVEFLKPHAIFTGDFGDPGEGFQFVVGYSAAQMFFKKFDICTYKDEPMYTKQDLKDIDMITKERDAWDEAVPGKERE